MRLPEAQMETILSLRREKMHDLGMQQSDDASQRTKTRLSSGSFMIGVLKVFSP
jgi:hypothetical protein